MIGQQQRTKMTSSVGGKGRSILLVGGGAIELSVCADLILCYIFECSCIHSAGDDDIRALVGAQNSQRNEYTSKSPSNA